MRAYRTPVQDEYTEAGESAVLVNGRVLVLSPLATLILGAVCESWVDSAQVAALVEAKLGPPPDGTDALAAIETALQSLADSGLLVLSK